MSFGYRYQGHPPHFSPLKSDYGAFYSPESGGVDGFSHCSSYGVRDLYELDEEQDHAGHQTNLITQRAVSWIDGVARSGA
jgi:hypothetical protein